MSGCKSFNGKPKAPASDGKPKAPASDGKPKAPASDGKPKAPASDGKPHFTRMPRSRLRLAVKRRCAYGARIVRPKILSISRSVNTANHFERSLA
jgi:hypothetical protein